MSRANRAVYGQAESGEFRLIKLGISDPEALELANFHFGKTGRTVIIVTSYEDVLEKGNTSD